MTDHFKEVLNREEPENPMTETDKQTERQTGRQIDRSIDPKLGNYSGR